jgi:protein-disulfide isomerase
MLKHIFSTLVVASLLAGPATATDINEMTEAERQTFRAEVRAYLLENPEVLMEAIAVLEAREAEAQAANDASLLQVNAEALYNDPASWVGGNPEGDVTIVEFLDYRCGFCRRAHPEVEALIAADSNIRLIVKEFPILGEQSVISSRFAVATLQLAGDDAYKAAHDALIAVRGELDERALRQIAVGLGLDADAILAHMGSDEVSQVIADNRALGQRLQINGTPSFVFADQVMRGYLTLDQMQALVEDARG